MNLLAMVQAVAKNAGIVQPEAISQTDPDCVLLVRFLNEAGDEVARRADWGALRVTVPFTGTGAAATFDLPSDYDRLSQGLSVVSASMPVRGSLTQDEWNSLVPVGGGPRYFYLAGKRIGFYPFMTTTGTAQVSYLSLNWAFNDAGPIPAMVIGEDRAFLPDDVLISGALWRWRRHVGKDFADYVAEFEAMLADRARFDGGVRAP